MPFSGSRSICAGHKSHLSLMAVPRIAVATDLVIRDQDPNMILGLSSVIFCLHSNLANSDSH